MASVQFNPTQVVVEAEGQGFEYEYPESGLIIVSDEDLKSDYLVVLPGDEEIADGVYRLVRVGDVEEVAEIESEEEEETEEEGETNGESAE